MNDCRANANDAIKGADERGSFIVILDRLLHMGDSNTAQSFESRQIVLYIPEGISERARKKAHEAAVLSLWEDGELSASRAAEELGLSAHEFLDLLAAYLNTTYFGEGAIGIRAAAAVYFGKPVEQLDLSEVALLVGLALVPAGTFHRPSPAAGP